MAILDRVHEPGDLRRLNRDELRQLAEEIRQQIISQVSKNGGHLASNLGVVELTMALCLAYDLPKDVVVWDVGHQCYAHKLLTGRCERFGTLRQFGGISGFPKRSESTYDCFGTGHSSTSISAALGFARARDLRGTSEHVVAVIGDGALGGGIAFEALNNAGQLQTNMLVVLNDNEMSISRNVGALATHLSKLRMQPLYRLVENKAKSVIQNLPMGGQTLHRTAEGIMHGVTHLLGSKSGIIFEEIGFTYLGPIDGHDTDLLAEVLRTAKTIEGPVLVHVLTKKGKGYEYAESRPRQFHGTPPFEVRNGEVERTQVGKSYTSVFGETLVELAEKDPRVIGITAAMPDGTGLTKFAERFPDRFYDVGIAEQHAVTFAAGLAASGFRPVVAAYSTFLQRAYDQIVHDVCLQRLPVTFAIDRAGLVGDDGPTHHGAFDISYLRHIPELVVGAPCDAAEMRAMLTLAVGHGGPFAIRYPRGACMEPPIHAEDAELKLVPGVGEVLEEGEDVCLIAIGSAVELARRAAGILNESGISTGLVNARFAKPLDSKLILQLAERYRGLVMIEENTVRGGFGSAVVELLIENDMHDIRLKTIGLPDAFVTHGDKPILYELHHLDPEHIARVAADLVSAKPGAPLIHDRRRA